MNREKLIDRLLEKRGAFFVSFIAETAPDMRKRNNPYRDAIKRVHVAGMLNWIYANSVNNQRVREGNHRFFTPKPRQWGRRLRRDDGTYTPFVVHEKDGKLNYYLELRVQRYLREEYFLDGERIEKKLLEPFLRENDPVGRQGVNNPIMLRDYYVGNIKSIIMDYQRIDLAA